MELDYETVRRAIKGNHNSQTKLLNHYDGYINSTERYCVGEVIKSESPTSCTEFVACRTLLF